MPRFSLQALGPDRPGVVAAVAQALASMGWNLEDSSMTILAGQFAIVLILDAGDIADGRVIETALASVAEDLNLFVTVRPLPDRVEIFESDTTVRVAVHGSDHPGIVAAVAREIAEAGADIYELVSRVVDGEYVMRLRVALPPAADLEALTAALEREAAALGVMCVVTADTAEIS